MGIQHKNCFSSLFNHVENIFGTILLLGEANLFFCYTGQTDPNFR